MNFKIRLIGFFAFAFVVMGTQAQQLKLSGQVTDSLNKGLANTNVIARPLIEEATFQFAITSQDGQYVLKLQESISYELSITHIGFKKIMDTISLSKDTQRDFILQTSTNALDEVIIEAEMAVIVKEDTITYRTDQFKTGEERKLRDIIKKLPGMKVDRAGNVTVNGKPVSKLMVDGKTFFTGDEKLGVNNIPADAVDEIVALDNYSEIAFLKGLEDSDRMALNIKLKEGKKRFLFGDVAVAGGVEERYKINPSLFYYSPKTAINFIGDLNNTGQKAFTLKDYINFEGGYSAATNTNRLSLIRDNFYQFLRQDNFKFQRNQFLAGSINQELVPFLEFNAYSIVNSSLTRRDQTTNLDYFSETANQENRTQTSREEADFSISKLMLKYDNLSSVNYKSNTLFKTSQANTRENLRSQTGSEADAFRLTSEQNPNNFSFIQEISANKQFSYTHTTSLNLKYEYNDQSNQQDWLFNQPLFSEIIPLVASENDFNLFQESQESNHLLQFNAKHYWVMNDFNHLYPIAGINYFDTDFSTFDVQILDNGNRSSFEEAGFNNQLDYQLTDAYFGFEYKFKINEFIGKPSLKLHHYNWDVLQFSSSIADTQKWVLLPAVDLDYESKSGGNYSLDYALESNFANAQQFANRLRLLSFNRLSRGDENLENQLYHSLSFRYFKFKLGKKLTYSVNFNYRSQERSIRSRTNLDGIDQIQELFYTSLPEDAFLGTMMLNKGFYKWYVDLSVTGTRNNYSRIINNNPIDYNSDFISYTLKTNSVYDDFPNLDVGITQEFNRLKAPALETNIMQIKPFASLEYDFWEDFLVKFDYRLTYFENQSSNSINRFDIGNASLEYWNPDKAWRVSIEATNIFNTGFRRSSNVSEFVITDRRQLIQPRIILLQFTYKL